LSKATGTEFIKIVATPPHFLVHVHFFVEKVDIKIMTARKFCQMEGGGGVDEKTDGRKSCDPVPLNVFLKKHASTEERA
jgi:hypothetical protein